MKLVIIMIILMLLAIVCEENYKKIRRFLYKQQIKKEENEFYRDIKVEYSPAVVSYLYNQVIEPKKDLISDILNLQARKIINIVENGKTLKIILNRNEYERNKIYSNDEYLIRTIILGESEFNYEKWRTEVKNVYRSIVLKKEVKDEKYYAGQKTAKWLCGWSLSLILMAVVVGVCNKLGLDFESEIDAFIFIYFFLIRRWLFLLADYL